MADPLSIASGILTLTVFAFQSSRALYQTVASLQNNQRTVRQLQEELEALSGALEALQETITNVDIDFTILRLPLLRCGKACEEFEALIVQCTAHSDGSKTSFRDWLKLKYMGEDVIGFKNMLAGYKSTIVIALGDANIEYKDLITNTTADLEEHLQEINDRLRTFAPPGPTLSVESAAEQRRIQEERDSTEQCLEVCAQVFSHIDQIQSTVLENSSTLAGAYQARITKLAGHSSARLFTSDTFKTCKEKISGANAELQSHLQEIDSRLRVLAYPASQISHEQAPDKKKIEEELDSIKQCLAICAQASTQANQERVNVFEDISTTDDSHQVLVSTIGDLISARRVTAGARSRQWLGQMSDDSLQQLSHRHGHLDVEGPIELQAKAGGQFEGRHGAGLVLKADLNEKEKRLGRGGAHDKGLS